MRLLQQLREDLFQVPQAEMARLIGVTQPAITKYEKPDYEPSLDIIRRYRRAALLARLPWSDEKVMMALMGEILHPQVTLAVASATVDAGSG